MPHALRALRVLRVLTLVFYGFAVITTNLFGRDFDAWFGTRGRSLYSLFQITTLESWSMGIVRPLMEVYPYAWAFFVPFILMASFTMLTLFIGIIVSERPHSMQLWRSVEGQHVVSTSVRLDTLAEQVELERLRSLSPADPGVWRRRHGAHRLRRTRDLRRLPGVRPPGARCRSKRLLALTPARCRPGCLRFDATG